MPGFNIAMGKHTFPVRYFDNCRLSCDTILNDEFKIERFTLKKFENDKIFVDWKNYIIVLEGVVLNKKELQRSGRSWIETVVSLYRENGESFFSEFRGSFSGAIFDKNEKKWIIFTDQIGSKHIYYSQRGDEAYLTSEIVDLYNLFKNSDLNYSIDKQGAYMLLSYGYMLEDFTLCSDIKKLKPGSYIKIENGRFSIKEYYQLPDTYDETITEDEAIEKVDELFRNAISLQFEKDKEYGYKHIVALSGGLDSRMTSWVAHEMGYTNQLNFTFSQSGYLDETIAKEIASDLKHEWIFKALDNGLFLKDIDEINQISGGNVLFYALAHGNSMLKLMRFNDVGILHTGQVGGILKGYYGYKSKVIGSGAYSTSLISKINYDIVHQSTSEREFLLKNRQFNGTLYGDVKTQHRTESLSPYLNIELINFGLTASVFKQKEYIMRKWILEKYPIAGDYILESTGSKLTDLHLKILGKEMPIKQIPKKILRKLRLTKPPSETAFHMNPLTYWYNTNPELKEFQDNYFNKNIERLSDSRELKIDCEKLYRTGNGIEKNQVLTLLSAYKLFFERKL